MILNKPPKQSIKTLIRKAIKARYNMRGSIDKTGKIFADEWMEIGVVEDWSTIRNESGCILLQHRNSLFFKFAPDT